jgi:hypothetical protein
MELKELLDEREWRKCRGPENATVDERVEAFAYFCETYWHIKHPEKGRIRFELREAQLETIRVWMGERYSIVLKARQIGFSTLAAAYSFWLCFFGSDRFVVMLSRTEREAIKLLAKAKYGYKALPQWFKSRGPDLTSDNQTKMTFSNESAIESLPSGNDPARGESVYLVIVDEWAFLPNAEEAWASIEPIADVGGRVIGLSTANGSGDFFHQMWLGANIGLNNFKPIFWSWEAGDRDEAWYEVKRRQMPDWQLHQEYPRTAEEAFIKSGNPVFDIDRLVGIETESPTRLAVYVRDKKDTDLLEGRDGEFAVWDFPSPDGVYVIGADVAEGLAHGDYSCFHVMDAREQAVVATWHGHVDPDVFGVVLAEIGWKYNGALVAVENNNHGLTTLKSMQRYGYKNLYRQRRMAQRVSQPTEILGWRTTSASKPLAIDELAAAIRDGDITLRCERTITELKSFVRATNGRTHGSPHDDYVMALAICWQMLKFVWLAEYRANQPPPRFSLDWFEKFQVSSELPFQRVPLGSYNTRSK